MNTNQQLIKGRIVRYVDENGEEWPAIVIAVHSEKCISVNYFAMVGTRPATSIMLFEKGISPTMKRTWFWPPRENGDSCNSSLQQAG